MSAARWYVCTSCGHFWASHNPPEERRCESCSRVKVVTSVASAFDAERSSARILAAKGSA